MNAAVKPRPPRCQRISYSRCRSSGVAARADWPLTGTTIADARLAGLAAELGVVGLHLGARTSGSSGAFRAGTLKFGVRWKTTSAAACRAMIGIDWIADEPVPMTPTRWPVKSTPACGQWPV